MVARERQTDGQTDRQKERRREKEKGRGREREIKRKERQTDQSIQSIYERTPFHRTRQVKVSEFPAKANVFWGK